METWIKWVIFFVIMVYGIYMIEQDRKNQRTTKKAS